MTTLNKLEKDISVEEWLAIRKDAATKIDAETAEVFWLHGYLHDPYGIGHEIPEKFRNIGRLYFARAPDSDVWVEFGDLPDQVRDKLRKRQAGRDRPQLAELPWE